MARFQLMQPQYPQELVPPLGLRPCSRTPERRQFTHDRDGDRRQEDTAHGEERKEGEGKLRDIVVHPEVASGRDDEE